MLTTEAKKKIESIWDSYIATGRLVYDLKGNRLENIDQLRLEAIKQLKVFIQQFLDKVIDIYEFKTNIDSFNKRNNLWGFTAMKGQMFFNQLVKYNEQQIDKLSTILASCIVRPNNLQESLTKIDKLESFCKVAYEKAEDRRKTANPNSVGYFLSYFWQVQNPEEWAILYTSQIRAYHELDIWQEKPNQKETYQFFYQLNEEIRIVLKNYTKAGISNWDIEHAFWEYKGNPNKTAEVNLPKISNQPKESSSIQPQPEVELALPLKASFELSEYLIPKVAKLVELGGQTGIASSAKGDEFERLVAEIFKQLDFDVQLLGQGTGRNPDAIIRFREENTAFIVDAKAYTNGYTLGTDDRAIKEYINHHCPKLNKEGYKKIGFIIVSNSFKSNFDSFINSITWDTDIKRFILLTSEALLYLLAFKTKDRLPLTTIIEKLVGLGNLIEAKDIIAEFDDV
ncbi:MAG: restriction endonuclease FokI C-terminal domain-containing protein [Dysgonomonas sp.]